MKVYVAVFFDADGGYAGSGSVVVNEPSHHVELERGAMPLGHSAYWHRTLIEV